MAKTFYNSLRDPVDNTISSLYHFRSISSTWSTSITASTQIFNDFVAPSTYNFPNSTATRAMLYLPGEVYYDGVTSSSFPFYIKDITSSQVLVRVLPNASLTNFTYKIFTSTSVTPGRLEIHMGGASVLSSDVLAWDGYFVNSIMTAEDLRTSITLGTTKSLGRADYTITSTQDAPTIINTYLTTINANGGGELKLLEGVYGFYTTCINALSNVNISGVGYGTILTRMSSNVTQIIYGSSTVAQITFKDFYINGNSTLVSASSACFGIYFVTSTNIGIAFQNIKSNNHYSLLAVSAGFSQCSNLLNCQADNIKSASTLTYAAGFRTCNYLTNCQSNYNISNSTNFAAGFVACNFVLGCQSNYNTSTSGLGYGFHTCTRMQQNTGTGNGTALFTTSCYADSTGAYGVSLTSSGGFNG